MNRNAHVIEKTPVDPTPVSNIELELSSLSLTAPEIRAISTDDAARPYARECEARRNCPAALSPVKYPTHWLGREQEITPSVSSIDARRATLVFSSRGQRNPKRGSK
jgi:hypothetical protein